MRNLVKNMPHYRTNEPKRYDAIIVGAGPAGCACSYELKSHNKSVLFEFEFELASLCIE